MPIRAVSFDLFDTLIDLHADRLPTYRLGGETRYGTQGVLHEQARAFVDVELEAFVAALGEIDRGFRATLAAEGYELPTLKRFGHLADQLGVGDPAFAERLTETHMAALRGHAVFVPHHGDVLGHLGEHVRIALCSNFSHSPTALRLMGEAGLIDHFELTVISDAVGIRKPRAEIFEAVLEGLKLAPEEVLHVGDRIDADVAGASALGIPTAWLVRRVRDPDAARERHPDVEPTYTIRDIGELVELLTAA